MSEPEDEEALLAGIQARAHAGGPRAKSIRSILKTLLVKRGITEEQTALQLAEAWRQVVGETLAGEAVPGRIQRGILYVSAANNLVVQELSFRKKKILDSLHREIPEFKIKDLRFRVDGRR